MKSRLIKNHYVYSITGVVVVASILIFLGFSRISKTLESNHAMVLTFRTFQQLNHNLNENMLRARAFLLENYDPLVANVEQVKQLCASIESPQSSFMNSKDDGIIDATESYCFIAKDTVSLVEKFKSKNSILRNSQQYLPTLISQFQDTPLEAHAERLLNDTLRYTTNPTKELEISIKNKISSGPLAQMQNGKYKESLKNLFFHVRLMVQSTQERSSIETEILSTKVNNALNSFESIYHKWHDKKERELSRYYFGLLFLCSSLVIGIYFAIRKLQKTLVELNEFNENLESKVESRTLQLSQALTQLELKQQMLLQSTKMSALGEMAGGIAHEINTPLGAIMLNAEMLIGSANETGNDEMLPPLEAITKTVERISKIIVGLRRFSRDSSQDAKTPTLISQIMEDTLTLCNEKIKASSVDLKLNYRQQDLSVPCIPEQISQVILNLLNNSVDAILDQPRDQRWIQISVVENGPFVEIAITDSGKGIPLAVRNKLMQPFFTTKEVGKGTGLGLSISKGIIDDHLGKLFYEEKSENTKFVVQLPLAFQEKRSA